MHHITYLASLAQYDMSRFANKRGSNTEYQVGDLTFLTARSFTANSQAPKGLCIDCFFWSLTYELKQCSLDESPECLNYCSAQASLPKRQKILISLQACLQQLYCLIAWCHRIRYWKSYFHWYWHWHWNGVKSFVCFGRMMICLLGWIRTFIWHRAL